jgi:hypothetical protein
VNGWLVFGASVRGPDHEREDLPCQDAWARGPLGDEGAALCLCDGAGSAAHPEIGATTASAAILGALREARGEPLDEALRMACHAGRGALVREASARGVPLAALSCTVVAVVAVGDRVAVAHIGDGAVLARRRGGDLSVLSAPERGEHANETFFLTSSSWESHLRVGLHEGIEALCALTDGCQDASLRRGPPLAPFAPFCAPLFDFAGEIEAAIEGDRELSMLLDADMLRRVSGDDKTLAVARRRVAA